MSSNIDSYMEKGDMHCSKGEWDLAIASYSRAIELSPREAVAYLNRGNIYRIDDELDLAVKDYDMAIEINPRYAMAYNNRGLAYMAKGETDRAIADFNKSIEYEFSDAHNSHGRATVTAAERQEIWNYFNKFRKEPLHLKLIKWLSINRRPYNRYRKKYLTLLEMIIEDVCAKKMSRAAGARSLRRCLKIW